MSDKQLDLIAKLLAKAERTNHQAEADVFMARAQQLATRHSIDLAMARAHTAKAEQREKPVEEHVTIGRQGQKGLAQYVRLFLNIAAANDVQCLIANNSTYVDAYGFPSDIELVQSLYASIVIQMSKAARDYLATGAYKDHKVWSDRSWEWKPQSGTAARIDFTKGYASRIGARLQEAARTAEATALNEPATGPSDTDPNAALTSMALVLREKRAEVGDFYNAAVVRNRAYGTWGGERRQSQRNRNFAASDAGKRAANHASLTDRGAKAIAR